MKTKKILLVCLVMFLLLLAVSSFSSPVEAMIVSTRTPKACHICETLVIPNTSTPQISTPTPTATVTVIPQANMPTAMIELPRKADIYLFWGVGCPHCEVAKPYLEGLDNASDQVQLHEYEVWYEQENQELFIQMAAKYGFEPQGVPTIFIGKQYWVGYSDQIQEQIRDAVNICLEDGCPDAGDGIIQDIQSDAAQGIVVEAPEMDQPPAPPTNRILNLPLLGAIDLSSQSLFVSTLLISFIDGFNACSIWVLTMLLALTLHTGSRKKVLLIGFIFLTVSTGVYGLFIAGLFTMFTVVSFVGWIQAAVALVAFFFAVVNIKDYFWYKEGISFTIADDKKPGIFKQMRKLTAAGQSFGGLVGGTIVLAAGVSLVEFSCTAGFPVLWSNLLVSQNVEAVTFVLLLLLYMAVYQLDEMGLFLIAVFTMRSSKMEEKHGRILKLISGVLMLALSLVMLINPNLMNDLTTSLIVFGGAFVATLLILLIHRVILPKFNIHFGTEFSNKK